METIRLFRTQSFSTCTRGLLVLPKHGKVFYSMEPPWKNNEPNISCIPVGKYKCVWHKSPKYGWVYLITSTPDRSNILIHPGNLPRHTKGCILLGNRFGVLGNDLAVLSSVTTVRNFFELMDKQDFILEIM